MAIPKKVRLVYVFTDVEAAREGRRIIKMETTIEGGKIYNTNGRIMQ